MKTRICSKCKKEKELSEYYSPGDWCKLCRYAHNKEYIKKNPDKAKEYRKKYYDENKEKIVEHQKEYQKQNRDFVNERNNKRYKENRDKVLKHYGEKCECCGESKKAFLAIDHKNHDGGAHRKLVGKGYMMTWIVRNNYPDTFRILCHNCNFATRYGEICPHKF